MNGTVKLVATLIIGSLVSAGIFGLLVNPKLSELAELNQTVKLKKTELITLEQQIRAYKNAQSDLSKASRKDEILATFVEREELVLAVKSLEAGAQSTRTTHTLKINEDKPDAKVREKTPPIIEGMAGLSEVPYRVTTLNDFVGTVRFLQYLEHLPQFTEVSKINLSAETVESEAARTRIYTGRVLGTIDGVFFMKSK